MTALLASVLAALGAFAWFGVLHNSGSMATPLAMLSWRDGAAFTMQWGIMMTAMMLPSASPMILLYRTVGRRLAASEQMLPAGLFATVYLTLWLLTGIPVYLAHVGVMTFAMRSSAFTSIMPYAVAATLALGGLYQFSPLKRACLRYCQSPLSFLMHRWRSGYIATLRIAAQHAAYCIGCCWALMVILVVAGAMSLPWVIAIAVIVFAEKLLPAGVRSAQFVGAVLILMALVLIVRPELAPLLRS